MANNSLKLSQLQVKNNADSSDQVVAFSSVSSNTDVIIPVSNLFSNATLFANNLILLQNNTPANSTANVIQHSLWSDGNYIYYAKANNVIVRASLSSF
jgi:hypothetical protein